MSDAATLQRLDHLTWAIMALGAAAVLATPIVGTFSIDWRTFAGPLGASLALIALGAYYSRRKDERLASGLLCTSQLILFAAVAAPLSYLAAAANLPLKDHVYDAVDRAMGLDWRAMLAWMNAHPAAQRAFALAYMSIQLQAAATVLVLAFTGRLLHLRIFVLAFFISALVCIAISALIPAQGAWAFYNVTAADYSAIVPSTRETHLPIFHGLRDGSLRALSGLTAEGIITFPSFHAALGVIFMIALWPVPFVRWIGVVVNVVMIVATPIDGGHYFVDLPAGIAIAIAALLTARAVAVRMRSDAAHSLALAHTSKTAQVVAGE